MNNYFEATVKVYRQDDQGLVKQKTERYLMNAETFTECETVLHRDVLENAQLGYHISKIAHKNYGDVMMGEETYFEVRYEYDPMDEGAKAIKNSLLLNATSDKEVIEKAHHFLSGYHGNHYKVTAIKETQILDVLNLN